jgi:uncharacterized protein (TIGR03435 family)
MGALAATLSNRVDRVVVDRTGLSGEFDLQLEYSPDAASRARLDDPAGGQPPPQDAGPSIFTALPEQLGLKLEAARGPVQVLVIDSVALPTPD